MGQYQPKTLDKINIEPRPVLDDITVVIPTLGRPILEESLYWIVAGNAWPGGLIVVDQGSSQQVAALIEKLQALGINAEHLPSTQRGRASGINRGLEQVKTRFVAITDDDCFVEADWLAQMVMHLQAHPKAIITGRVEPAGNDMIVVVTSRKPAIYHRPRLKFDALSGGNTGTSMSAVRRIGFFDEDTRLRTAEDGEWAYRALRTGVPIIYAPDVVVRHYGWRDESERAVQYRDYARSHGGFYGKYLRKGDWFIALRVFIHLERALRRWLRGILSGDQELVLNGRAYATGLLPGIIAGLRGGRQR
jgi:GT2 family glycosyltransferase